MTGLGDGVHLPPRPPWLHAGRVIQPRAMPSPAIPSRAGGPHRSETITDASPPVSRLIGLLAVAFAWSHLVGEKRAEEHGPPLTKAHGRRNRSLFRYGLDRLQGILTTPQR